MEIPDSQPLALPLVLTDLLLLLPPNLIVGAALPRAFSLSWQFVNAAQ